MLLSWMKHKVIRKVGFEDIKKVIEREPKYLLINTLDTTEQNCLIRGTLSAVEEEKQINSMIENQEWIDGKIIVYGRNSSDESAIKKAEQLAGLGIFNVFVYQGGLFEWLLLQDVFGDSEFPTTSKVVDILKFRPIRIL